MLVSIAKWNNFVILKGSEDMEILEIMRNVNRLPLSQQMLVAERIIHSVRQREQLSLEAAAERLYEDYLTDERLTAFTTLDREDFHEAR
jgi:hypothetical protein